MKKMTPEEIKQHRKEIAKFNKKMARVDAKLEEGDIGLKKALTLRRSLREECEVFIRESGVIMYYGTYFRAS
jgi:hypothetical protein